MPPKSLAKWEINPNTGRKIKIGGPTWLALTTNNKKITKKTKKRTKKGTKKETNKGTKKNKTKKSYKVAKSEKTLPLGKAQSLKSSLEQETKTRRRSSLIERGHEMLKNERNKVGSRTRGWSLDVPTGLKERQEVYDVCGQECFLAQRNPSAKGNAQYGFPICRRCIKGKCTCEVDPRGLFAAEIRAKQHNHQEIAKKASALISRYNLRSKA